MEIAIILNSGVPVTRKISADKVICADGGFLLSPVRPDYLVGDLDSLKDAPEDIPLLKHDSHKNFTDGESAVYFAKELGADIVTLYGVTGGRCDHFLGNLAVMALAMKLGMKAALLLRAERGRDLLHHPARRSRHGDGRARSRICLGRPHSHPHGHPRSVQPRRRRRGVLHGDERHCVLHPRPLFPLNAAIWRTTLSAHS